MRLPSTFPPHPRLFLNRAEIDTLKKSISDDSTLSHFVSSFIDDRKALLASGFRQPDSGYREEDNLKAAELAAELALAHVLCDDDALAKGAADILLAYTEVYPTYEVTETKGRATGAALSEATFAINLATAYDLIYGTGVLTEKQSCAIEGEVLIPCAEVLRNCNHPYRSNWRNRAMAGFGAIGFCLADSGLIDEALNGKHENGKLIRDGFVHQLAEAVLADGVYYERSIGYHLAVLENYAYLMEAARHSGVDLWHHTVQGAPRDAGADRERRFGHTGAKSIRSLYEMPFYYAFADLSLATVGNAKAGTLQWSWFFDAAYRQYDDPKFAWISHRAGESRPSKPLELLFLAPRIPPGHFDIGEDTTCGLTGAHSDCCTFFPNGGYTVLRQHATPDAVNLMMTFGKYGSGHSHPDILSIVLSGPGGLLLPEVNYFGYGHADFLTWNNQTIAHNTVTVDETAQYPQLKGDDPWITDGEEKPVYGVPVFFHTGDGMKAFRADCDTAYDGVHLSRAVAMVDDTVIDFFTCESESVHIYDYALHVNGRLTRGSTTLQAETVFPKTYGYGHLKNSRVATMSDDGERLVFTGAGALLLDAYAGSESRICVAEGREDDEGKSLPVVILRQHRRRATFAVVMRGSDGGQTIRFNRGAFEEGLSVEISHPDGRLDFLACMREPGSVSYRGVEARGRLVLFRSGAGRELPFTETVE